MKPGRERREASSRRFLGASALLIAAATAAAFAGSMRNGFVSDDRTLIGDRISEYRGPISLAQPFRQSFWKGSAFDVPSPGDDTKDYYRPLVTLSYILDAKIWGDRPWGFRLANLALHLLCTGLLLALLRRWGVSRPIALAAALVFACHPVHVCSIVWIAGRTDLWATAFLLAALYAADRLLEPGRRHDWRAQLRRPALWLMAGALLLSLFSKEIGLVFPALILLLAHLRREARATDAAGAAREATHRAATGVAARAPLPLLEAGLSAALIGAFLLFRAAVLGLPDFHAGQQTAATTFRFGMFPTAYAYYWRVFVFPGTLHFHVPLHFPATAADPRFLLLFALLLVQIAAAVLLWKRIPLAGFGIAWVLVTLLPVSHLVPLAFRTVAAEYWAYLPSAGFVVLLAGLADRLAASLRMRRRLPSERARAVAAAVLGALALAGLAQIPARSALLRTEETLLLHTISVYPAHTDSWVTLGAEYGERGELDRAERYLREAIRRDPKARGAWMNLANIQYLRSEIDSAAVSYHRELENHPHKDEVRIDLADIHLDRGDDAGAAALYREALQRNPRNRERILYRAGLLRDIHLDARDRSPWPQRERELALAAGIYRAYLAASESPDAEVLGSLARLELSLGRFERAAETAERLLALRPGSEEARALDLLARTGLGDAAAREAALSTWSGDPRLSAEADALAELLRTTGRSGLALPFWRVLLRAKRVEPEALNHAAASLLKEGKPAEAAPIWELLNEEIPDYPYALLNLGAVALGEGKTARARSLWERFLALYPQRSEVEELRRRLASLPPGDRRAAG